MSLAPHLIENLVRMALAEDLGHGHDITSRSIIPMEANAKAVFRTREDGVLAGSILALSVFSFLEPDFDIELLKTDGDAISKGDIIATVEGPAAAILTAERSALNFMIHLSGIASQTRKYVNAVKGTNARICDTRKTLAGLRAVQKYAVTMGGGYNHRFGLDDAILIKDNHIAIAGGIKDALSRARASAGHMVKIEIEVDTLAQLEQVLQAGGADIVMFDNFNLADLKTAVEMVGKTLTTEASGGVNLNTVADIAATGVDYISIGALTHSSPALDIGLDIDMA